MSTAKVFRSGNSQAVRLPKAFRLDAIEVEIVRRGEELILRPLRRGLSDAFALLASLPDDFMAEGRRDAPAQRRKDL
jgi:antitoxin VapB